MTFVPDEICSDPRGLARLEAVGLGRLKGGAVFEPIAAGPSGGPGLFVSWPKSGELRDEYSPDWQTWRPAIAWDDLAAGRYWVGITTDDPPTPKDLAWKTQAAGQSVKLGDGNFWEVPYAATLTLAMGYGPGGEVGTPPRAEMTTFAQAAQETYSKLLLGTVDTSDLQHVMRMFCAGLAVNYGIVPEVISLLKLFNSENIAAPLYVAVESLKLATVESIEADIKQANLPELESEFLL